MSHKFTSLELYELIWSEPLSKLGQRMGISDVAIAKHCRKASIPLPGVGIGKDSRFYGARPFGRRKRQLPKLPELSGEIGTVQVGIRG